MNLNVNIDWKFVIALGASAASIIFAIKMDAEAAERVSIHAVDVYKSNMVAGNSNH